MREGKESMTILYLEDDKNYFEVFIAFRDYHHMDFQIIHALTVQEAIEIFERQKFDVVLCDYHLVGEKGVLFLEYVRKKKRDSIPFAIITEDDSREVVIDSLNKGADYFFEKFSFLSNPEQSIKSLYELLKLKDRSVRLNQSERMKRIFNITVHDIKNSLTVIGMTSALIREMSKDDVRVVDLLSNIDSCQRAISEAIQFSKDYWDMGEKNNVWNSFYRIIERIKSQFSIEVINDLPKNLEVFCDVLVEKAFYNLIENSIHHGNATAITFSCIDEGESISIFVKDNGTGIVDSQKEVIFKEGFGKHTGYGLFFCREVFTSSGMTIEEVGDSKGACFLIVASEVRCRFKI